jgi:AcrR family transcriptional regulator
MTVDVLPDPETQSPETQSPETQSPETQSPETQSPETQSPETQSPETLGPETLSEPEVLERAADAALSLAGEGGWTAVTLRDIAEKAGVKLSALYRVAPQKGAVVDALSRRLDQAALRAVEVEATGDRVERLFEATMARLEAMEPNRFAILAMAQSEGLLRARMALRLAATAQALLEGAGVDTSGRQGAVRVLAMITVWTRVLSVWRDDEGALNRTMAEIDKRLKQMRQRLARVGAGF